MFQPIMSLRNIMLISILILTVTLSLFSYYYSSFTAEKITSMASEEIRSNLRISAHDLARIFALSLQSIEVHLKSLSTTISIQEQEFGRAFTLLDRTKNLTHDMVEYYMWLDKEGNLFWRTDLEESHFQSSDFSYSNRTYLTEPKRTLATYYSNVVESRNNISHLFISYPVLDMNSMNTIPDNEFKGALVAAIKLETLGKYLHDAVYPNLNVSVGLIDRNGVILYSSSSSFIGENIFDNHVQSKVPIEIRDKFNEILKKSLSGKSGVEDIEYQGNVTSIAYQPVMINGEIIAILELTATHHSDINALITEDKNVNTIIILTVGSIAIAIGFIVITWNKQLQSLVHEKTLELTKANNSLSEAVIKLQENDKLQKEFINIAAHELRTPIQSILSFTQLAQMIPAKRDHLINDILRNAKRLQRLSSDILDVTRIETNSMKLNVESFNLTEVINNIVDDFKYQIKNKNVLVINKIKDVHIVEGDKARVTQVIINLIDNAIKFTAQGRITISAHVIKSEGELVVTVKDTGSGISSDIIPKLFSKFATNSDYGTGLGLYISKSIIEAHRGRIWAKNNTDAIGASFSFSLPIIKEENKNKIFKN